MSKERKLAILKDGEGWLRVHSPYSANFVDYLKINISSGDREPVFREVDGKKKFDYWRIRSTCLEDIYKLMSDFWPDQDIVSDLDQGDDWVDTLFQLLPEGKLDIVYRALSQAFHPDVGGDEETMKRINLAYEIRKNPTQFWE